MKCIPNHESQPSSSILTNPKLATGVLLMGNFGLFMLDRILDRRWRLFQLLSLNYASFAFDYQIHKHVQIWIEQLPEFWYVYSMGRASR